MGRVKTPPHRTSGLVLSDDSLRLGLGDAHLIRAQKRGELVRVRRGVYCDSQEWESLEPREKYVLRMRAVAASSSRDVVFCGYSAAAVWGMPIAGAWPELVHVVAASELAQRTRYGVVRHPVSNSIDRVALRHGLLVTDVAWLFTPDGAVMAMSH